LHDLRKKLARQEVTFVQEFNPLLWPQGAPPRGEPVITRVMIISAVDEARGSAARPARRLGLLWQRWSCSGDPLASMRNAAKSPSPIAGCLKRMRVL
jgi:hypothetical protein